MIRVLLVGRGTQSLARAFDADPQVETETAQLPAAAVRQMEATPPDAICLYEASPNNRTSLLVQGIRARPLGQLTPIVLVAPQIEADWTDAVDAYLSDDTPGIEVVRTVRELLGVDVSEHSPTVAEQFEDDVPYYIEEIVEFRSVDQHEFVLDGAAIRRKLKAVRHEDYFVILEVKRGAETSAIREAFFRLSGDYELTDAPFAIASEYESELLEIADAIQDAWAVLGDPDLRARYLQRTTRT